jgi:hypothetical protein
VDNPHLRFVPGILNFCGDLWRLWTVCPRYFKEESNPKIKVRSADIPEQLSPFLSGLTSRHNPPPFASPPTVAATARQTTNQAFLHIPSLSSVRGYLPDTIAAVVAQKTLLDGIDHFGRQEEPTNAHSKRIPPRLLGLQTLVGFLHRDRLLS